MQVKSIDRRDWRRVPEQAVHVEPFDEDIVVYLKALEVKEALIVNSCGSQVRIMDKGYLWIFICKKNKNYVVTVQCNEGYQPVQWYVDIIRDWQLNKDGFPVYKDLYLDILRSPEGKIEIVDQEELQDALKMKAIDADEFKFAWQVARQVQSEMQANTFEPVLETEMYIETFRDLEKSAG